MIVRYQLQGRTAWKQYRSGDGPRGAVEWPLRDAKRIAALLIVVPKVGRVEVMDAAGIVHYWRSREATR